MHFDTIVSSMTLDASHLWLVGVIFVLLISQVILLTAGLIALLRRRPEAAPASVAAAAPVSAPLAEQPAAALAASPSPSPLREATPDAALQLLSLLQNEARFIDFVQENVSSFTDAEIGAVARIVHDGCRKVIHQHFELEPVRKEAESSRLTLPKGFDAASVRLVGNIVGQAPFTGTLVHRGWRVAQIKLPKVAEGHDTRIITPAEVEL